MVVKGEAIVIVLDVGKSMHKDESDPTALEEAKKCISLIIQRKIFSESKDEIALIIFGCDDVSDDIDKNCGSDYENIKIAQSLHPASWKLSEFVSDIQGTDTSTDFIRDLALETAINLLQNSVNAKKIDSQRILFFSSFDGNLYSQKIDKLCDELKVNKIEINVIGPIAFPEDIKKEMGINECDKKIITKVHISDLLSEVNGESYSFSDVLPALMFYQMKKVEPYPTNLTLDIGTLQIPISVFITVSESKPKTWANACIHNGSEKPRKNTTYRINDVSQTEVSSEGLIQAFKYGTTLVPYSQDDKKNMDYQPGERGMKLLGFTKREKIPRYLYSGDKTRYVFSQKNNESAGEALAAFIQVLHDTDMVAIVRFVSTARSAPVIGFLSSKMEPIYECLVFIALPFMEDLHHYIFTPLDSDSRNVPTEEQLNAVDELISAMDMTTSVDDNEDEMLNPLNTNNPYIQRLYQCLQYRAYHPEKPLPEVEPHIQAIVNPLPKLLNRAETSLKKIKSLFPMKEYVPKKLPDSKSHLFSNSNSDKSVRNNSVDEDVPETKFDVTDTKLVDAMADKITQVGSINPVRDIQYLINNQVLPFSEICDQINDVLNKLLQENDRLRFNYPKILSICKEYRCSSLKEGDCVKYNCFMLSLRKHLLEINEELWDKIRNEKITLISKDKLSQSTVTPEEAETFLLKQSLPENSNESVEISVPCDVDDDEEDLMDQL